TSGNCLVRLSKSCFIAVTDSVSAHLICFTLLPSSLYPEYSAIYTCNNCTFFPAAPASEHAYSVATNAFSEKSVGTKMVFIQLSWIMVCKVQNPDQNPSFPYVFFPNKTHSKSGQPQE